MLLTNLKLDKQTETPLYTQIIDSIKNQLYNDQIAAGDRLPSVRRLSAALQISRTTVENAYNQLVADGYLQTNLSAVFCSSTVRPEKAQRRACDTKYRTACRTL